MSGPVRGVLVIVLVVVGLAALSIGGLYLFTQSRFNVTYDIQPAAVDVPPDARSIASGEEMAQLACAGCHGQDMAGQMMGRSPLNGRWSVPNLTSGEGGIGATYTDVDWVRAIRHGVGPDGRALIGMPSDQFVGIGDPSLGALIAFLKSVPPVDNDLPAATVGPLPRFNYLAGRDPLLAAELIDHESLLDPLAEREE